jgi:hypothetical protein
MLSMDELTLINFHINSLQRTNLDIINISIALQFGRGDPKDNVVTAKRK